MAEDNDTQARRTQRRNQTHRARLVTHPSAESNESGLGKTVFESDDENAVRRYIETNHPRGREIVLQTSDGRLGHFSADLKAQGHDNEGWLDYSDEEV